MKKLLFLISCLLMCAGVSSAKDKAPEVTDVSIVGEGIGNGGRPIIIATCSAKKAEKVTDADLIRCAVRGVLFQGWNDKSKSQGFDSSVSHPAVAGNPDAEAAHADFFSDFFASGDVTKYGQVIPDTRKVVKSGKLYQVSQAVSVNVPALRKKLERDGIIKSLNSGW